jgi:dTDP-4-amino-4,6-dideoxygalactose transaminase
MVAVSVSVSPAELPAIPILDLTRQTAALAPQLEAAMLRVLHGGTYILGPEVRAFEAEMASYLGVKHTLGVANGTDALYLALRALNIGEGDEVITTSQSYIATSEAITRAGAKPVFVDLVDNGTYNLDVSQIEAKITPRTKALLPVHLYGQAADMAPLLAIAQRHNLAVIEDCAQAIGATYQGKRVGSLGTIGCFSFFPSKNLGAAGDAGLVCTNDDQLAEKIKQLRVHGQSSQYDHASEGINSRLDEVQAALLRVKLPHIDHWNAQRRTVAAAYAKGLADLPGIGLPTESSTGVPVYHQWTFCVPPSANGNSQRDALQAALQAEGIMSRVYYPIPLHRQGMHQDLGYPAGSFPVAERLAEQVLSLPMFPELTEQETARVVATVRRYWPTVAG